MEKTLQRQLLEMLQTLEEGIRYIGQEGNPAMLRECITAIRAIRETCQQSLPVKRQAVYVDLFDGMAQALQRLPNQADQATLQQTTDLCQELIEYARQALQKELTRKKIMVFLPYKASMWDSLESVWKAAYEDKEHCETYVIPIPYCDRNPDMTAKEWHCEAGLFPDYVPVLDWRDYSRDKLREMHPDVIFIHNPYDNFNAVTSVDMQYYSRNLKGIAEKLVYIPYFVVGDTIAPHFCQTQGVINADYVIVQDENIKEQYERYYPGGNPPKGKILALGSPKFDKVCNTTKDDYTLPEEWQRLIGNKKVILYNTSLTAMLEHTDKFNAKLRYVFDIFKQRDDVVLWWRPHPLLRATIDSMTPAIRNEYRQIEQAYINEGWGIYDDTPEMERAIVCTDAYYGDMSSLVWLYKKTGKPVMIQSMPLLSTVQKMLFYNIVYDGTYIYFLDSCSDTIFRLNYKTGKLQLSLQIPFTYLNKPYSYGALCKTRNKFILLPLVENKILEYDLKSGEFKEAVTLHNEYIRCGMGAVLRSVHYKNSYYFIPIRSSEIIKYDECTEKYSRIVGWYELVKIYMRIDDAQDTDEWDLLPNASVYENHLLLPFAQANIIIDIDMDTDECSIHSIGNAANRYQDMTFDGCDFWLLSRTADILTKWNYNTGESTVCDLSLGSINQIPYLPYNEISYNHGLVHLYPGQYHYHTILSAVDGEKIGHKASEGAALFVQKGGKKEISLELKNIDTYLVESKLNIECCEEEKKQIFLDGKQFQKCFDISSVAYNYSLFEGYRVDLLGFIDKDILANKFFRKKRNKSIAGKSILHEFCE